MPVGGPFCPKRHPQLYGTIFAFGGLEQANGAASPAISSMLLPAPLGSAATIALDWGVQGGGPSTKEGCRLAGRAELAAVRVAGRGFFRWGAVCVQGSARVGGPG